MTGKAQDVGVLAPHADGFAVWLAGRGYVPSTVEKQLRLMSRLGEWLADERIPLVALDEEAAGRFARAGRPGTGRHPLAAGNDRGAPQGRPPVSYTHLTLPTN